MEDRKNTKDRADDMDDAVKTAQFRFALISPLVQGLFPMKAIRLTSCVSQRNPLLYPTAGV